jgi:anti-sigma B factor antagonist
MARSQSGEPAHLRALLRFCDDGRIEIDNNAAERACRSYLWAERIFFLQVPMVVERVRFTVCSVLEQEVLMETAVGVFATRERAEEAVKSLLGHHVPRERIIYLTRSESDAKSIEKQIAAGGFVGGAARSAGVAAATLLAIPGVGPVFALGSGAATLFGLPGAGTAAAIGASFADDPDAPVPPSETSSSEDLAFFRRVLNEGYSVVVVRAPSFQIAASACEILDRLGISMEKGAAPKSSVTLRQVSGAVVADILGKIALAEGTGLLRETVRNFLEHGHNRILLNLEGVDFIDSAGLGELVRAHASIRSHEGQLKLVKPSANVHNLLRLTKLDRVFEIEVDEFTALKSLRRGAAAKSTG